MYKTILVTLDSTPTDRAIINHIKSLAKQMRSRVVLFHVITSVPAKIHGQAAAGPEVQAGETYLSNIQAEFATAGITAEAELAYGDPVKEIVNWVQQNGCDLVAMSTHGHQFVAGLVLGKTAIKVQHSLSVPVLMLRAK
ncbi:MAG: universal stress protein [Opitutaceae bacterium]|nr:universal stress protein [Opitutaceae bacterium]